MSPPSSLRSSIAGNVAAGCCRVVLVSALVFAGCADDDEALGSTARDYAETLSTIDSSVLRNLCADVRRRGDEPARELLAGFIDDGIAGNMTEAEIVAVVGRTCVDADLLPAP